MLHPIPAFSAGQLCPACPSPTSQEFILGLFSPQCTHLHTWSFTDKNPKSDCLLQQYSICHLNHLFIPFYEYFNAKNISTLLCYFHGNLKRACSECSGKQKLEEKASRVLSVLGTDPAVTGPKWFSAITGYKMNYSISDLIFKHEVENRKAVHSPRAFSLFMDWIENQSTVP